MDTNMNRPSYTPLLFFFSRFKLMYVAIMVLVVPVSVLEGASVAAFLPLFTTMLGDTQENVGGIAGFAAKAVDLLPMPSAFGAAALLLIAIFFFKTVGILARDLLVTYTGAKIMYSVKQEIIERYSTTEFQFILDNQQGTLIYRGIMTPNTVSRLHLIFTQFLTSLMKVMSIGVVLVFLLPYLTLALVGLGLVYYVFLHYVSKRFSFRLGQERVQASTEQAIIANEFINGFRQIISFDTARRWTARFAHQNRLYSELFAKDLAWRMVPRPLLELSAISLLLGFVVFLKVSSQETSTADLVPLGVFAVALVQILGPLSNLVGTRLQIMSGLPDLQIAHQILTSSAPPRREGHQTITSFKEAIVFQDVSFAHKGRKVLLDNVNMTFEKGKVTAIVGPSGSGKTTLINLILGLFDPSDGRITVDGVPLEDLTHESWLGRLGLVSQDPFIYNTTIEENIRFNRSGHTKYEIIQAATTAVAHDFISEFPQRYDTTVGDQGIKLSGGQQQRICIARAVLASPEILIFDEATSSLDSIAEKQVQQAIDRASTNRTVIVIAHRLSTIRHADKIIVIDNGAVIEQGTHEELLTKKGHFSRQVGASV